MNAERLLKHYEKIADGPDAIARLRRFILDLAVRGKLLPQDAKDEPATELETKIAKERELRIKLGEIRRGKPLFNIEKSPFKSPRGWSWMPLGDIGHIFIGNSINDATRKQLTTVREGLPFIATKDVGYGLDKIDYENGLLVEPSDQRFRVARADSVLICAEGGSAGKKVGLTDRQVCFGNKLLANETWSSVASKFVLYAYMSDFFYEQFAGMMKGVIGGISISNFMQLPFCLPPLAEQHRIVAKVDELMTLCDRLEVARSEREATRDRLTAASLARLNAPDPETFHDDARFALDALPALTGRTDQIKQLRQTILNLAVRGKLVPQNPNDEPASELLKRIAKDKTSSQKSPTQESIVLSKNDGYEPRFALPIGWSWASLNQIAEIGTGLTPSKTQTAYYEGGNVPWINSSATSGSMISEAKFFVTQMAIKECRLKIYPSGSLVVALYGQGKTRGQVAELGLDATVNQACAVVQWLPSFYGLKGFVKLTLEQQYDAMRERAEGGPQPNLNVGKIKNRLLPLPPLAEQHRIVAKADELLALSDRLEASLAASDDTRRRLLEALLAEALAPDEKQEQEAAE